MTPKQLAEGLEYARFKFENDSFSWLDKQLIKKHFNLKHKHVLDFGCGMGDISIWLAGEMGAIVDGIDLDKNHINVCLEFNKEMKIQNVNFYERNVLTDPISKQYDLITLNDVVEHIRIDWLKDILDVLIHKNLKPGGSIFISYPPWQGPWAGHLNSVTKIPWIHFYPKFFVDRIIQKRNFQLVGKNDLRAEYDSLNRMSHRKLSKFLSGYPLEQIFRKSHTKFNQLKGLQSFNFNFFPLSFLVTKELVAFKKHS